MRIGIDIRPLQTSSSRYRGIGRYTYNQILALLEIAPQESFFLFYDPRFDPPTLFEDIVPAPNWTAVAYEEFPELLKMEEIIVSPTQDFFHASALQILLQQHQIDVFHYPSPFEYEVAVGQNFAVCPTVVMLHDLIPLLFATDYLWRSSPPQQAAYLHRLNVYVKAKQIVSNSEASKHDVVEMLGIPSEKVDVIFAGVDESFSPLNDVVLLDTIRAKFNLPETFILSVLDFHYSKNMDGTIAAYSLLPLSLRQKTSLVIVFNVSPFQRKLIAGIAKQYDVEDKIILTGFVSQEELVALYNSATVFFYPSRYDGFGLPVAEAMRCGTPVITSTSSCLPEVGGDAALFADPDDHQALAVLLEQLLTDKDLQQTLKEKGFAQAKKFSWRHVASDTLQAYKHTIDTWRTVTEKASSQFKIAFWGTLTPDCSGVFGYNERLPFRLAQSIDMDIFSDVFSPEDIGMAEQLDVFHYRAFGTIAARRQYDLNVYQITGQMLDDISKILKAPPGVVDLLYPIFNAPVLESALGVIVHSQWEKTQFTAIGIDKPVVVIPYGVDILSGNRRQTAQIRQHLGIAPNALVALAFGWDMETACFDVLFRTFARLISMYPDAVLLLVDSDAEHVNTVRQLVQRYGIDNNVKMVDCAANKTIDSYLRVADILINLQDSSGSKPLVSLYRALGAGLPALVSDLEQFAELPDDFVWKVGIGKTQEDELVAYLLELALHPDLRCQMGRDAQNHIAKKSTWSKVTKQYVEFFHHITSLK